VSNPDVLINFREIFLAEPRKHELIRYLTIEHSGELDVNTSTPARHAKCLYDVILPSKATEYHESTVDISSRSVTETAVIDVKQHASLTL
jgi:primary-amine oxidase